MVTREQALRIVHAAFQRAGVSVTASLDEPSTTLVVLVKIAWVSHDHKPFRSPSEQLAVACAAASRRAQRHREMFCLWGVVNSCVGFDFVSNGAFWSEALAPSERPLGGIARLLHGRTFPEVALLCDFDDAFCEYDASVPLAVLEAYLRGLAGARDTPSDEFRDDFASLTGGKLSQVAVECAPTFYLGHKPNELYTGVMEAVRRVAQTSQASTGPRVVLSGVRFPALHMPQLSSWYELDHLLPSDLPVRVSESPPLAHETVATSHEFLTLVCGLREGASARFGRVEHIGFSSTGSSGSYAGQLFSLLPFAQSVRGVRFYSTDPTDFLWLTYAAFHPRVRETKWRILDVGGSCVPGELMQTLAFGPVGWDHPRGYLQDHRPLHSLPERGRLYRTAYTARTTRMRSAASRGRSVEVTIARGVRVEVCDLDCASSELPTEVSVVVPGYGMLLARKTHLAAFEDEVLNYLVQSCVSTLACRSHPASLRWFLEIFGPWRANLCRTRRSVLVTRPCAAPQRSRQLRSTLSSLRELEVTVDKGDFSAILELLFKTKNEFYRLSVTFASLDDVQLEEAIDTLEALVSGSSSGLSVEVLEVRFDNSPEYLCSSLDTICDDRRRRKLGFANVLQLKKYPLHEPLVNVVVSFAWRQYREFSVQHPNPKPSRYQTVRCVHSL